MGSAPSRERSVVRLAESRRKIKRIFEQHADRQKERRGRGDVILRTIKEQRRDMPPRAEIKYENVLPTCHDASGLIPPCVASERRERETREIPLILVAAPVASDTTHYFQNKQFYRQEARARRGPEQQIE